MALQQRNGTLQHISSHLQTRFYKTDVMAPVHNEITNRWEELDEEMKEDFGEEFFQTCEAIIVLGVHFA